jgi:hypothetical protein
MKTNLRTLLKEFHELPLAGQDSLLKSLYNFSPETRLLMANYLSGQADFSDLIGKMESETTGKVSRWRVPDARRVSYIVNSAVKARAPFEVMMELEQLAYSGFIDFLNLYGGGPDSFLTQGPKHLEAYLLIVKNNLPSSQQAEIFEDVRKYLLNNDNMDTGETYEVFESVTGIKVRHPHSK